MLPTLIGPELENTGKITRDKSVNKEKETADYNEEIKTAESKVDNVE